MASDQLNRSFNPSAQHMLGDEAAGWNFLPTHYEHGLFMVCCAALVAFAVLNLKGVPGIWHMRLLNAFRFILRTQRPPVKPSSSHIFQPLITSSSAQIMELDFNIHKTNSSYFSDLDISRTHLVCTLFAQGIERMRGGTAAYTGSRSPPFGLALGGVMCNFRKEIHPYEHYDMWSRVLSWDDKWIYIVTHFVRKGATGPQSFSLYPDSSSSAQPESCDREVTGNTNPSMTSDRHANTQQEPLATALSKCVFKSGRKTISPHVMLDLAGLLSPNTEKCDTDQGIEAQRVHGLKMARVLAAESQKALEQEFNSGDGQVLARHSDGSGVTGVISTLLQLAGLKGSQFL